jgi:O-methyltransferase
MNWTETRDLPPALQRVRPFTMISNDWLTDLARLVQTVLANDIPGDFVECGVWRGGASFLMADLLRQAGEQNRKVWLFDSFEGLPPPEVVDGPAAQQYAIETTNPYYYDNCRVSVEEVRQAAAQLGLAEYTECVQGWFDQTLPAHRSRIGPIALLRLDCDWHASMRCCLDNLYDQVADGGFVAVDDYFGLDGCALAVHEFLGERHLAHRIESFAGKWTGVEQVSGAWTGAEAYADAYQGAVIRKGGAGTWKELRNAYMTAQDIVTQVPAGGTFILVDYGWLGEKTPPDRLVVPLFGSSRQHSRPGDNVVLQAVERGRQAGAGFLVFAWPTFWWIDQRSALARSLRSRYRCLLENERVVVFSLYGVIEG